MKAEKCRAGKKGKHTEPENVWVKDEILMEEHVMKICRQVGITIVLDVQLSLICCIMTQQHSCVILSSLPRKLLSSNKSCNRICRLVSMQNRRGKTGKTDTGKTLEIEIGLVNSSKFEEEKH